MRSPRLDYHVHESYSSDAETSTVEKYIETAEKQGLEEIAFTTHMIIKGPYSYFGVQLEEIPEYIQNIHRLDETTDIKLLAGLEIDYFSEAERQIQALLEEHPLDYTLGSTHFIGQYDIGSRKDAPKYFSGRSIKDATTEYFETWRNAVESQLFDAMAHPDYWRRFIHLIREKPVAFFEYGAVHEAIDSLISCDVGIELNTSGIRHNHGTQYPITEFLEAAYNAGLKHITIGSDSHTPEQLGYCLPEAVALLQKIGYKHISRYRNRKNESIPISQAVRNKETLENLNENS